MIFLVDISAPRSSWIWEHYGVVVRIGTCRAFELPRIRSRVVYAFFCRDLDQFFEISQQAETSGEKPFQSCLHPIEDELEVGLFVLITHCNLGFFAFYCNLDPGEVHQPEGGIEFLQDAVE